jgi:polyhydroxybutyrate depolymerase
VIFGGDRPATLKIPKRYAKDEPLPLVIILHGYAASGTLQELLLGYDRLVDQEQVFLISPDGTIDDNGKRFWNATDACCDFYGQNPDDVDYIIGLIEEIQAEYCVDPRRIFLVGHSNGGFLAYRIACEHAQKISAVIAIAAASYLDPTECVPADKVSVLHIHGDMDQVAPYDGGYLRPLSVPPELTTTTIPGAIETAEYWSSYNSCSQTRRTILPMIDLDSTVTGAETEVERFEDCPNGIDVDLWTIKGGQHVIIPTSIFTDLTFSFLNQHPK